MTIGRAIWRDCSVWALGFRRCLDTGTQPPLLLLLLTFQPKLQIEMLNLKYFFTYIPIYLITYLPNYLYTYIPIYLIT